MNVTITGASGTVGLAVLENQEDVFEYTLYDREKYDECDTIVGDISDYSSVRRAFSGQEGVVHLAADPNVDAGFDSVLSNNIIGAYNCLEACRECEVTTAVLASSNHVVGMYEQEHAPELYRPDYDLTLDHTTPVRPDSLYGTSKVFLEALGRYYVENYTHPKQVYALRIGSVRKQKYDHPFGDAEEGFEEGEWKRDSDAYRREADRMKATWQSRRDVGALVECCLLDDTVTFDIFYGVSDNAASWFDISHAREVIGYEPRDSADDWDHPH
jgi:dTDP-4-dehydrorhamnose reductase